MPAANGWTLQKIPFCSQSTLLQRLGKLSRVLAPAADTVSSRHRWNGEGTGVSRISHYCAGFRAGPPRDTCAYCAYCARGVDAEMPVL
jgi:hypothetical protein